MDLGPILNSETPRDVPLRPMGSIPVIARLVLPDREEWRPATAIRWTPTHVMVRVEEHRPRTPIKRPDPSPHRRAVQHRGCGVGADRGAPN